jgi:fructose-bisphosphate aldolase, class II
MQPLRAVINEFKSKHQALGHFNFSDSNQLKAIAAASRAAGLPVIAGLSEGEREFFPLTHARALVDQYQKEGVALYLNADHTYSTEKAKAAIDAGVDSIVVDGAQLPTAQNIALVKAVVAYARQSGRDVMVEGELGYIGTSSNVLDALPEGAAATEALMTKPEEAAAFVAGAGVDAFAPAVGNIHGMLKGGNPKISPERVAEIAGAVSVPLTLHGGSGISDGEFRAAIQAGIALVHINTEFRLAYRDALKASLAQTQEVAPYKYLAPVEAAMQALLVQKMQLFAGR